MRGAPAAIAAAVLCASLRAAFAHSEADAYQCESNDWDKRIAACTGLIQGRGESKADQYGIGIVSARIAELILHVERHGDPDR